MSLRRLGLIEQIGEGAQLRNDLRIGRFHPFQSGFDGLRVTFPSDVATSIGQALLGGCDLLFTLAQYQIQPSESGRDG